MWGGAEDWRKYVGAQQEMSSSLHCWLVTANQFRISNIKSQDRRGDGDRWWQRSLTHSGLGNYYHQATNFGTVATGGLQILILFSQERKKMLWRKSRTSYCPSRHQVPASQLSNALNEFEWVTVLSQNFVDQLWTIETWAHDIRTHQHTATDRCKGQDRDLGKF